MINFDFLELAKARYSSRNYKSDPIEKDKILAILEAGRVAPSAANYQPWHFIVVQNNLVKLHEVYNRSWFKTAPAAIVICGDHSKSWKRADGKDHCDIDIAITADHITLAATNLGLATCWICNFDAKKCSENFSLPAHIEPAVILSLGYPADAPAQERHNEKRFPMNDLVHWEIF